MSPGLHDGFDEVYNESDDYFGSEPENILVDYVARIAQARPILDVGAGQGRHSLFLAREGLTVDAIDPSRVAVETISAIAMKDDLHIRALQCGFETFRPDRGGYGAILLLGILQILSWEELRDLVAKTRSWLAPGGLVFITAWTVEDPYRQKLEKDWSQAGKNSFSDGEGLTRTFFEEDEILEVFEGFERIHHWEGLGSLHRHGDNPPERHGRVEAVLRKPLER